MNLCPSDCPCLVQLLCIVWWKPGCPCMAVCLYPRYLISVPTPCLECVHASVHVFMSTLLPILAQPPMYSYMESWLPLCVCTSHPACGLTPCLECVHASVHEFMSTWLPMSGASPMHRIMETCVLLCVTVCVFQSPCLWSHTLCRMCTCILHVFMSILLPTLTQPPMDSYMETLVPPCFTVCVPVTLLVVPHLV